MSAGLIAGLKCIRSWRNDRAARDRARRKVLRSFPGRISANAPLVPGTYGGARRLEITAQGIDYTACQYSAMEIWPAVLAYFNATNEVTSSTSSGKRFTDTWRS
jgi:hypothetical protein